MNSNTCPKCGEDEGYNITPSFQNIPQLELTMIEVQCRGCKEIFPILNIKQIGIKVDKTFEMIKELRKELQEKKLI